MKNIHLNSSVACSRAKIDLIRKYCADTFQKMVSFQSFQSPHQEIPRRHKIGTIERYILTLLSGEIIVTKHNILFNLLA
jgi:hypothetical protein